MQKLVNTLKLPKIDDFNHKSQPYLHANKDNIFSFQHTPKGDERIQLKFSGAVHTEGDSTFFAQKRGVSLEKPIKYKDPKEGSYFVNPSIKQNWLLKKMDAQRETFQKRSQLLGTREFSQFDTLRQSNKVLRFNQGIGPVDPYDKGSLIRRKVSTEDTSVSKSMNLGKMRAGRFPSDLESTESLRKRIAMKSEDQSTLESHLQMNTQGRVTPNDSLYRIDSKAKLPVLSTVDDGSNYDLEKGEIKVKLDLILKIQEKLYNIFEHIENKSVVTTHLKAYLELLEPEEVIQVESLFYDTRTRRNIKSYIMIEKTSVFILLYLLSDETISLKDAQENNIRNIGHYVYSNFLNFCDILISKLEAIPKFKQAPNLEELKKATKKKIHDIDRSFSLEQVNKLLLKNLKTTFKFFNKKPEQSTKLEHLLEKIEFGLMLNYFEELKVIFHDLLVKYSIKLQAKMNSETGGQEPGGSPKKSSKAEKQRIANFKATPTPSETPIREMIEKEFHLPPPYPKAGQEDDQFYTLVLDMDETLIHFEEVAGKGRFFVRPHAEKFLKEMSEYYEIVVFTAGVKDYADAVLNILDPNKYITHRLYRQHTTLNPTGITGVIKDLSKIGRDLSKTIIIDNAPENFRLQVDNGIEIVSWFNDPYDTELLDLMPFLKGIVEKQVDDVRKSIKKYKEKKKFKKH